jgi:hypothetical protein
LRGVLGGAASLEMSCTIGLRRARWMQDPFGLFLKQSGGETTMEKADHAMGLELQLVELVEQQARAEAQHRDEDAARFDPEITQLRSELAAFSELALP